MKQSVTLRINGTDYELYVDSSATLLEVIRDELGLTGTKAGCGTGACGACTVQIDGKAVKSCLVLARQAGEHEVTTIEGLGQVGHLHPVQQAFIDRFAVSCGFCTPGMIVAAAALLTENAHPTEDEVRHAMVGNLCRCTGYVTIVDAVLAAAEESSPQIKEA